MPTYRNCGSKRIMIAAVQRVATAVHNPRTDPAHYEVLPANRWVEVGETIELSEAEAQTLEGRVVLVK